MNQSQSPIVSVSSDLVITAPKVYLEERFEKLREEIESGNSFLFNYSMEVKNLGLRQSLQVTIQTDYAGWIGKRKLINSL